MTPEEILNKIKVKEDFTIVLIKDNISLSNFVKEWKNSVSTLTAMLKKQPYQRLSPVGKEICKIFTEDEYKYSTSIKKTGKKGTIESPSGSIDVILVIYHLYKGESYNDLTSRFSLSYEEILSCLVYFCHHGLQDLSTKQAYSKFCNKCGERIWMVETINGWQPFEANQMGEPEFNSRHIC